MTRLQLRTLLKRRLGNRTDLTDADLDLYLDNGIIDLGTVRFHIRHLEAQGATINTTIGVNSYVLDSDTFALLYLEDTTNRRVLTRFPGGFFEFLQSKQTATSDKPSHFIEFGSNVYINTPDASGYALVPYRYKRPAISSGDGGTPNLPEEWHYPILLVAAAHAFRDIGDDERVQAAEQELQTWVGKRDSARKMSERFNIPSSGARPAGAWQPGRLGV